MGTLSSSTWQVKKDYPFTKDIFYYSILATDKKFILFGGYSWSSNLYQSKIARFDPIKNTWTELGNLSVGRHSHGVIQVSNEFIVVCGERSGDEDEPTESCKFNEQSMTC